MNKFMGLNLVGGRKKFAPKPIQAMNQKAFDPALEFQRVIHSYQRVEKEVRDGKYIYDLVSGRLHPENKLVVIVTYRLRGYNHAAHG